MRIYLVIGAICTLGLLFDCYPGFTSEKNEHEIPSVSLALRDVRVDSILKDVSKQSAYTIYIEGELTDEIVSGKYTDVQLDRFFQRIFKKKNVVVDIDTMEKNIVVHLFGSNAQKDFVKIADIEDAESVTLPLSNVSLAEMRDIFAEEYQIDQDRRQDPDAVMPFSNITKMEFEEVVGEEALREREEKEDPEFKVALSDLSLMEARFLLEKEGQKKLEAKENPDTKIALSNMTRAEFSKKMQEETIRSQEVKNNPESSVIPFSNVTYAEFHSQQEQ